MPSHAVARTCYLSLFCFLGAAAAGDRQDETSFRGSRVASVSRRLNSTASGASPPDCKPGYVDVSGGRSYYWSCAFFCDGGPYYAQANCMCACLTVEQAAKAVELGLVYQGPQPTLTNPPGQVLVTAAPGATTEPSVPVEKTPIGELDGDKDIAPPTVDGYVAGQDPTNPSGDLGEGGDPEGFSPTMAVILAVTSTALCLLALLLMVYAFWTGALKRDPTRVSDFKYVEPPVISLQAVSNEVGLCSRASSRNSAGCSSRGIQEVRTSSRRSSNASQGAFYDSGTSSTTASHILRYSKDVPPCGPFPDSVPRGGPYPEAVWAHKLEDDDRTLSAAPRTSSRASAGSQQGSPQPGSRRTSKASVDSMNSAQVMGMPQHLEANHLSPEQRAASRHSGQSDSRYLSPSQRLGSRSSAGTGRRPSHTSEASPGARRDSRTSVASVGSAAANPVR